MNLFDLLIVILLIGSVVQGYQRGMVLQAASLIGYVLAIWIAYGWTDEVAPALSKVLPLPDPVTDGWMSLLEVDQLIYSAVAFVLLFFVAKIVWSMIISSLHMMTHLPVLSLVNRSGGVVFSLAKATVVLLVVVYLLNSLPWETGQEAVQDSWIAQLILDITPGLAQEMKWLIQGQM